MGKVFTEEMAAKFQDLNRFEIILKHTKAVGVTFRPKEDIEDVIDGDRVVVVPEIDNQYDKYACMIMNDRTGKHIGYLKKDFSQEVWENIQHGDLYVGKVQVAGVEYENKGFNLELRHLRLKDRNA